MVHDYLFEEIEIWGESSPHPLNEVSRFVFILLYSNAGST